MQQNADIFLGSLQALFDQIAMVLPHIIGAALLLLFGWLIAKLVRKLVVRILKVIKIDVAAEKIGIDDFLVKGGIQSTTVSIVASIIYWLLIVTLWLAVFNMLGLVIAEEMFARILGYIPSVFVAVILFMGGGLLAGFVSQIVRAYFSNLGTASAEFIARIAKFAIYTFAVLLALEQLSIGGTILTSAFQIVLGGLALAFAIAFGWGGKVHAEQIIGELRKKF